MVEEEEFNAVFSALSHPLRRNILSFIVERGPQGYSELLTQFSLETGTLNYHLERMTAFLEQNENGKYKATNVGYAANKLLATAKTELSNPHAPPVGALGLTTRIRQLTHAIFDTLFIPEQAFEDAQSVRWPYLLIGGFIVAVYLLLHIYIGEITYYGVRDYVLTGIFALVLLSGLFILSGVGIYRKRFSIVSAVACYSIGFLPLTIWTILALLTDPTYSALKAFLTFLLLLWSAYLFLLAGKECFNLMLSQSFTSTAVGFVAFFAVVRVVVAFQLFTIYLP